MSSKILLLLKSSEIYIRLASAVKEIYKMGCASLGRPLFVYGSILPQSVKKSRKTALFLLNCLFCYLEVAKIRFSRHESRQKRRVEHRGFAPLVRVCACVCTHLRAHSTAVCVFCCHKCHIFAAKRIVKNRLSVDCRLLFLPFGKQRVVFSKTTCRFLQNNVSFSSKQRVVSLKTTCYFMIKFAFFAPCSFGGQNALVSPIKMYPNFAEKRPFWGC